MGTRKYEQRKRAEAAAATRRGIAAAAARLHETVGPAATTISAVAEEAGVQRPTVYRHFPTEESLLRACQAHFLEEHPPPQPTWFAIDAPDARLAEALRQLFAYYSETAAMNSNLLRDAPEMPVLRSILAPWFAFNDHVIADLAPRWDAPPERQHFVRAAIAHAIDFRTWQTLIDGSELGVDEAVDLLVEMTRAAARPG